MGSEPAPIPQYLLIIGILLLVVGVPFCSSPITFVGCQPSLLPVREPRKPIFPIRKNHAAPAETSEQGEASTSVWRGSDNLSLVAAAFRGNPTWAATGGRFDDEKIDRIYEELRKK